MNKILATSLFFAIAVFTACNPDECKNREYLPVFPNVVNNIPYQDGQVVRFKTNAGDTVKTFVKHILEIVRPDYPEVCEEVLTISLTEPGKPYTYISFLTRGSVTDLKNIIQMDIPMSTNGTSGGGGQIEIQDDGTLKQSMLKNNSVFHPTILLGGLQYEKVVELNREVLEPQRITQIFYNATTGVIQFSFFDGLVVNRIPG
jgi:hypothetical protein